MTKYIVLGVLAVILLGAIFLGIGVFSYGVSTYNKMVSSQQTTDSTWAEVENQYQRRLDLIPNLVGTVQGAANFEKSTLVEVAQARASVGQIKIDPSKAPTSQDQMNQFAAAQQSLGTALSRLLVVSEKYPDLKSNQNFLDLQAQLEGTENRITTARNRFNDSAKDYNTMIAQFPGNFVAGFGHFEPRAYFQAKAGADVAPTVKFDN